MKVGYRETSDRRQNFPIERFVDVLADVLSDIVDAFVIALSALSTSPHTVLIVYQNTCSLL